MPSWVGGSPGSPPSSPSPCTGKGRVREAGAAEESCFERLGGGGRGRGGPGCEERSASPAFHLGSRPVPAGPRLPHSGVSIALPAPCLKMSGENGALCEASCKKRDCSLSLLRDELFKAFRNAPHRPRSPSRSAPSRLSPAWMLQQGKERWWGVHRSTQKPLFLLSSYLTTTTTKIKRTSSFFSDRVSKAVTVFCKAGTPAAPRVSSAHPGKSWPGTRWAEIIPVLSSPGGLCSDGMQEESGKTPS